MEENLVQIDDLIAIASCSENIVLFIQEKDIETPGTIAIQANFRYGQFHIDNIDNFLRFTRFEEIKSLSIRKGYVIKLQQAFSDDDLLKMLVQLSLKEVSTSLDTLEKGKVAQIGEIREWSGQKMKKTATGWIPVNEEERDREKVEPEKVEPEKQYSEEELATFARKSSESHLKQAASGSDEKLRIAAQKELVRREDEEKPLTKKEVEKEKENKESLPSTEKVIEKLRTLSDEQIKHYYNAPYDRIKNAAKFIADERGLTLEDKFEPLELNDSIEKMDDFINSFDRNLIDQYSSERRNL